MDNFGRTRVSKRVLRIEYWILPGLNPQYSLEPDLIVDNL
jgi:hypothetical protein